MTKHFFEILQEKNIPTHYISTNMDEVSMTVKDASMFGNGLEVICRYRAVGSFYRRYGAYCKEGQTLDAFVEVTIKDDERGDPPISKEALEALNILNRKEYEQIEELTKRISEIIKVELDKKHLELYDIKLEFGREKTTGSLMLIDEISGGNMRVYNKMEEYIELLQLEEIFFS